VAKGTQYTVTGYQVPVEDPTVKVRWWRWWCWWSGWARELGAVCNPLLHHHLLTSYNPNHLHAHTAWRQRFSQDASSGAPARKGLQVPSVCHQLVWKWTFLWHCCLQDLHARVPWCPLSH